MPWATSVQQVRHRAAAARHDLAGFRAHQGLRDELERPHRDAELDIDAVAKLRAQTLQMPLPWVFDWAHLQRVDTDAAMQLSTLFRLWAGQALEMRWMSGERLFTVLQEAAPTGVKDADPAFWLTRLDALRLVNRVDQFDETAIDYCVTYEVSPPSWEPTRCNVRISGSTLSTRQPQASTLTEPNTGFVESSLLDDTSSSAQIARPLRF